MKALWNGESTNEGFRIVAGILAIASIAISPLTFYAPSDTGNFNFVFGSFCLGYVVAIFASVAIRGKAPTGLVPWK